MKPKIDDDEVYSVIEMAINQYGPEKQILMAIEELGELQHELIKILRHENLSDLEMVKKISEEMADVRICLFQLVVIFDNAEDEFDFLHQKIARLKMRLSNEK